jgi:hypothetical protein
MRGIEKSAPPMAAATPTVVRPENLDVRANVTIVYEMGPG